MGTCFYLGKNINSKPWIFFYRIDSYCSPMFNLLSYLCDELVCILKLFVIAVMVVLSYGLLCNQDQRNHTVILLIQLFSSLYFLCVIIYNDVQYNCISSLIDLRYGFSYFNLKRISIDLTAEVYLSLISYASHIMLIVG